MVFSLHFGFIHQLNLSTRYNWNIVESGVKHYQYQHKLITIICHCITVYTPLAIESLWFNSLHVFLFFFQVHAEIRYNSKEHIYTIQDKGSQNGTYVNEERLSEVKYTTYLYNTRQRQPEWYICQWREAIRGKIYNIFVQYKTNVARMVHMSMKRGYQR